jgi:hypothetical protein
MTRTALTLSASRDRLVLWRPIGSRIPNPVRGILFADGRMSGARPVWGNFYVWRIGHPIATPAWVCERLVGNRGFKPFCPPGRPTIKMLFGSLHGRAYTEMRLRARAAGLNEAGAAVSAKSKEWSKSSYKNRRSTLKTRREIRRFIGCTRQVCWRIRRVVIRQISTDIGVFAVNHKLSIATDGGNASSLSARGKDDAWQ